MGAPKLYLTKSRFKTGHECANKLFFMKDKRYASTKNDNDFLRALAEGGFQVGELAKIYHPGGINIETLDKDESLQQTKDLLAKDIVTIYEAAFTFEGLFVRVDVVEKRGQFLKLIEVKSKSFDFSDHEASFFQKRNPTKINSEWEPYLLDAAFQSYVVSSAYPEFHCTWSLKLPDKSSVTSVDGLNQRFYILPEAQMNARIEVLPGTEMSNVGDRILKDRCVDAEINQLLGQTDYPGGSSFQQYVKTLNQLYNADTFPASPISKDCKNCEYRISAKEKADGALSGFDRCFTESANLSPSDLEKPLVFDIRFFGKKTEEYFSLRQYLIEKMDASSLEEKERDDEKAGWSRSQRQVIQIDSVQKKSTTPFFHKEALSEEIATWKFPYHFIDFETSKVAIPFNSGRRPYEEMAFQFSHHVVEEDGTIRHAGQYLHTEKGQFPNFDFVRALKKELDQDHGTIFRYSNHENTVLRSIRQQILEAEPALSDAKELTNFIDSITSHGEKKSKIFGPRCMVDLCDVVERLYHHPLMGGSTSIKKVLPAILNDSKYLQQKYSKAIYGSAGGIASLNFQSKAWIQFDGTKVVDPYKSLPKVFEDYDLEKIESRMVGDELKDGGGAMTAYARMQFSQMDEATSLKVREALLRYCELDTFAMVLIWEYFAKDLLSTHANAGNAA